MNPLQKPAPSCFAVLPGVSALVWLCALAGCSNSLFNSWFDPSAVGSFTNEATLDIRTSLSIQDTPAGIAGATEPTPADLVPIYEEYRVAPGDTLNFRIFELLAANTETSVQATIDEIGTVSLPELGQVRVAGMTRGEIEQEIIEQLDVRGVIRDAQVIVEPVVKRNNIYTVFGATPQPNIYPLSRPDTRLLEAVNIAGGLIDSVTDIFIMRNERPSQPVPPGVGAPPVLPSAGIGGSGVSAGAALASAMGRNETPQPQATTKVTDHNDLIEAVVAPDAPPTRPAGTGTTPPGSSPTAQPRWIYNQATGEWISTTAPAERQPPGIEATPTTGPAPDLPVAEPQIDWDRLAGESESRIIRISAASLRDGSPRENIVVRAGDTIRIVAGQTGEYYIMGQVIRPGAYSITGRQLTLKAAIASAGNLSPLAWPDRCTIYRRYGDREEMHQVNLDAIFAGKESDVLLKNNDVILVGTHPAASFLAVFRNAFRMTYGFGFVYDRNFADIDSFQGQPNPAITNRAGFGSRFPNLFR